MKRVIAFFAYLWAGVSIILLLSAFVNMDSYQMLLMKLPFMRLDPEYSGGEVAFCNVNNGDTLKIHEPVFSALFGESKDGFVQIDIITDKESSINIVDYDNDGNNDFILARDNGHFSIDPCNAMNDYEIKGHTYLDNGWLIRVGLQNPRKR